MANKNPNTSEIVRYKKQESESKKQEVLTVLRKLQLLDDPISHLEDITLHLVLKQEVRWSFSKPT